MIERAIRAVVDTWFAATRSRDIETVLSLMTDDVVFMVSGQQPFGRDAFAAAFEGLANVAIEGTTDIVELQVMGEWAYLRNRIEMTVTPPNGARMRRAGYTLTIFRRETNGRWRLARDANLLAKVE